MSAKFPPEKNYPNGVTKSKKVKKWKGENVWLILFNQTFSPFHFFTLNNLSRILIGGVVDVADV
jgi:hypothetical protein